MRIHKKYFTNKLRAEYNMDNLPEQDGYICCKIKKGMYGLKEAGCVALQNHVKIGPHTDIPQCLVLRRLWCHQTKLTTFTLAVDNFGINFLPK